MKPETRNRMPIEPRRKHAKDARRRWHRLPACAFLLSLLAGAALWAVRLSSSAAVDSQGSSEGPTLRIGVVRDSTHVRLIAYAEFEILSSAGRAVFTCAGPNVLRFSAVGGRPGTFYYYVVVAEFEKRNKPQARRLLTQLREALTVGMEILETSPRLAQPKDRTGQGKRLLVAVGPFDDLDLADQWKQYLLRTYPAYIVKDTSKRATGEIHLYDRQDRLLARMKDSLAIRLKDERQLLSVEALEQTGPRWADQKRTRPRYRGSLEIRLNDSGRLTAINALSLEEYVKGVVPSEIGATAPFEALKAQAITARSEALHKLGSDHHLNDPYDFCDRPHCQTYHGLRDQTGTSVRAVTETRGLVLVNGNEIVDAVYCHSCGGVSADSRDVWRSLNYPFFRAAYDRRFWRSSPNLSSERRAHSWLDSRPDVFCNPTQRGFPEYAKKYFRWTRHMDGAKLEQTINRIRRVGQILDLEVVERAESGRVRVLRVHGSRERVRFTGGPNVCLILGDLPSSFFVLDAEHDRRSPHAITSLTIRGGGFGHGVGMCQMGARMMAHRGYSCEEILGHYYPQTSITKAY